ncbi:MAG: NADPH:quinone oxidoreductase family protein [Anaerolineae bacterium]
MKAVLCKAWGEPSTLGIEEVDSPAPGPGQVRIAVHACGINFADVLMVMGQYQVRPPFPFSPGFEVAGQVLECGPEVTGVKPGDRVFAFCDYGGFAEEVVAPAVMTVPLPDDMDFIQAAAFPVAYGTSHVALTYRVGLQPGETLLVHGAAGGVGLTAVEIGKRLGATVIAAASTPEKLQLAARYGADQLINYSQESIRDRVKELTGGRGADVIFDPVGGDAFEQSLRCISWEGRLLTIGFASGRIPQAPVNLVLVKNFSVVGFYWGSYLQRNPQVIRDSLDVLLDWFQAGTLKPHISLTVPLERAAEGLYALLKRKSTGKVVVTTGRG